ncbi:HNH endonuclease [Arthrobacter zhaoxinii]|uniref:HNH endonuclease n=1 Tax=Arthrobacter zhaoxinii TaxID=2964616 RepID=A0ABY5YNC4_9MICC|nr:HNH endonuclease signature motif containing protein [Arthrobacter zhaoxinii]UWX96594.1 HNH endonuclease [Arthrobacter zhaoxinii]
MEFASAVEEISRIADYLKLTAAAAVDRQRPARTFSTADGLRDSEAGQDPGTASPSSTANPSSPMPGGRWREFRSTADFLRSRLRISRGDARRRLALAASVLPRQALTGETLQPVYPLLAGACAEAALAASDLDVIAHALEEALPRLEPEAFRAMEKQLADIGSHQDHDFLVRTAKHWIALLDQDQPPSEEELSRFQGIFPGRRRNGLNHLHIYCTDEQHEALTTLTNSAANPHQTVPAGNPPVSSGPHTSPTAVDATAAPGSGLPDRLPRPTRPQMLLEGLLAAVRAALSSGGLPAAGGLRPQVMVTISHQALLAGLAHGPDSDVAGRNRKPSGPGNPKNRDDATDPDHQHLHTADPGSTPHREPSGGRSTRERPVPGRAAFTGPIGVRDVRKLACDADLIPVVLGTQGQVLDLGRAARLFPPHLRKALQARDRGCTFPGCTIPGPWTEAHHATFWERGGGTDLGNGMLLCSFHHHLIHQEKWRAYMRAGVPWFVPPPYVDPDRRPLRNAYFHPEFLTS